MIKRLFTFTFAMLLLVGCSSGGKGEGSKSVESFKGVNDQLAKANAQVDKTLAAMDQMSAGGDLSKSFANYTKQVDELESQAKGAKNRGDTMRKNLKEYVAKWQSEMEEIDDPTITASMQERREAVKKNFAKVRDAGDKTRQAYAPFISRLRSIQKAIQIDLTPAAVTSMKPAMDQARTDGANLKSALTAMGTELATIRSGMSAAPAKP